MGCSMSRDRANNDVPLAELRFRLDVEVPRNVMVIISSVRSIRWAHLPLRLYMEAS